jgi:hypothetical protein
MNIKNNILIDEKTHTIRDMKIEDKNIFNKIVEKFGSKPETDSETDSDNITNIPLQAKIPIFDFFNEIIPDDNIIIGFVSLINWTDEEKQIYTAGSHIFTYTINS